MLHRLVVIFALVSCTTSADLAEQTIRAGQSGPPGVPTLTVGALVGGDIATLAVTEATPGDVVSFGLSTAGLGTGPCVDPTVCVDLLSPMVLGSMVADSSGMASLSASVPAGIALGTQAHFQAVTEGLVWNKSDAVSGVVSPAARSCTGSSVPGDYPTIQGALDDGASSVCLGEGTFYEDVEIPFQCNCTIAGAGREHTRIVGDVRTDTNSSGAFTLQDVDVYGHVFLWGTDGVEARLTRVRVACSDPVDGAVYVLAQSASIGFASVGPIVEIDGADLSCPGGYAVSGYLSHWDDDAHLVVRNSYVHDSAWGIDLTVNGWGNTEASAKFTGNTIANNGYGMFLRQSTTDSDVSWTRANNVIVGNGTGVRHDFTAGTRTLNIVNNAVFDNTTDHVDAGAGSGLVTADPELDWNTVPPRPSASSPLVGAADPTLNSGVDYWDQTRTRSVIGSVE